MPFLVTTGNEPTRERLQSQEDRDRFDDTTKCILCAACTTSCPVYWSRRAVLRPAGDRRRAPVHLRQPRRGHRPAPGDPQRQGGRVALPHDLQLHRGLPPRHRGHQGDPGGEARADLPALTLPNEVRDASLASHREGGVPFLVVGGLGPVDARAGLARTRGRSRPRPCGRAPSWRAPRRGRGRRMRAAATQVAAGRLHVAHVAPPHPRSDLLGPGQTSGTETGWWAWSTPTTSP